MLLGHRGGVGGNWGTGGYGGQGGRAAFGRVRFFAPVRYVFTSAAKRGWLRTRSLEVLTRYAFSTERSNVLDAGLKSLEQGGSICARRS